MPLICLQLKTISFRVTSFLSRKWLLSGILLVFYSLAAQAFEWPFNTEEFQKKISAQDLAPSIRIYARGPTYFTGQIWDETAFTDVLKKQTYRLRNAEQPLMNGDAKKIGSAECKQLLNNEKIGDQFTCWSWQTNDGTLFTLTVDENAIIQGTYIGTDYQPHWKASLDPVLVAQYKNKQPVMQNELKISDFPVNCLNAVMAIEDNEFLEHSGLSYMGLTRSLIKNISQMRYAQGGSTITQQLVKNYFLTPEKTLKRKLTELYLATRLESEWTKNEILETYLNIIYMGQTGAFQVIGFGAASQYYFNKPVQQLDLAQCSLMAAIINNPGLYNPWKNTERATKRRNLVLSKMLEHKLITQKEHDEALQTLMPKQVMLKATETAPYFFEAVFQQIADMNLIEPPKNIYTSLDLEVQEKAQTSLQKHIADLEENRKNLKKNKESGLKLEGLVISTENRTGLINALVGGQNYRQTQFNRALYGKRQIGSLIKPFVYYNALIDGNNPLTIIKDEKFIWTYDKKNWSPENYEKKYHGEVPLYFALKESLNSPAAQLAQKSGIPKLLDLAKSIGLHSPIDPIPAASLGSATHYPIEIIDAYRTFANLGKFSASGFIEKLTGNSSQLIFNFTPKFEQKLDENQTAVLIGMMKETLRSGTAKSAALLGWHKISAGKTGTTSDNKDVWFAGFTPELTTVVWLGYDQPVSSKLTGGSGAVPIWTDYMKTASMRWPDADFKFPENVEIREVDLFGTDKKTNLIFLK